MRLRFWFLPIVSLGLLSGCLPSPEDLKTNSVTEKTDQISKFAPSISKIGERKPLLYLCHLKEDAYELGLKESDSTLSWYTLGHNPSEYVTVKIGPPSSKAYLLRRPNKKEEKTGYFDYDYDYEIGIPEGFPVPPCTSSREVQS